MSLWPAARRRPLRHRDDSGQALVLVLLVSMLIMLLLSTATTTLVAQIRPAKRSIDDGQAMAAAQAGIEDFTAKVNSQCPDDPQCSWLVQGLTSSPAVSNPATQAGVAVKGADGTGTAASFVWTVTFKAPYVARLRSVGQVPVDASRTTFRTTTLVADFNAQPGFPNLEYYTKFETYSPDYLDSLYTQRSIRLDSSTNLSGSQLASTPLPGTLTWRGLPVSTDSDYATHGTGICNDLYYPSSDGPGRGTNTAYNNPTRRASSGSDFAWVQERGTYTPASGTPATVTHNDTCDVAFEPDMIFNGPVYTQDAYLLNDVKNNNKGAQFNDAAYSLWSGMINGVQQPSPHPEVGPGLYRTFASYPLVDGDGYPLGTHAAQFPTYTTNKLDLPADPSAAKPLATCTYTGPTRVLVKQGIAYVTSPGTAPASSGDTSASRFCYTSTGAWANTNASLGGGVVDAQVPVSRALIYVKNPSPLTPQVATPASPVFQLGTSLAVPAASSGDTLAGSSAWTDTTTYSPTSVCPSPPSATLRRTLDCETGTATPTKEDVLAGLKATADAVAADTTTADADVLKKLHDQLLARLNGAVVTNTAPGAMAAKAVAYTLTVAATSPWTTTTTTSPPALTPADPFLQQVAGGGYSTAVTSWAVTLTRYACGSTACGTKQNDPKPTATTAVSGTVTRSRSTATAPVNSSANFPWFGTSYSDANRDVTTYSAGYGDAYVEGTLDGQLSLVAEHDILLTGDATYANTNLDTTNDGWAFVAGHNVRVYRPLSCVQDDPTGTTSPGWCPDDITGTYTTLPDWPGYPPATVYKEANAPAMSKGKMKSSNSYVYGSIFALRGSFLVDNVARGGDDGTINVFGGLYQYHRGVTKVQFQGHPAQSNISRPGMTLAYNYDNLKAGRNPKGGLRVPWLPTPSGQVANRTWNVTAVATGS